MKWCARPSNFMPMPKFALCNNEDEFKRWVRRQKVKDAPDFMPSSGCYAAVHTFDYNDGDVFCIVTIGDFEGRSQPDIYGLIAHEAVHIWQKAREMIGEASPSSEMEAYFVQFICTQLFYAYEELQ